MKTTFSLLIIIFLTGAASGSDPVKITGPYEHKNLSVYLIHGVDELGDIKVSTLDEAMKAKKTTVSETGNVQQLQIENGDATHYVFGLPGDIVKGGKQDRTLPNGFLLPPMSGNIPIDSFCVEKNRWSQRGGESLAAFAGSSKVLSGRSLKLAAKVQKSQGEVWKNVAYVQASLSRNVGSDVTHSISASSLQLALEDEGLKKSTEEFILAINKAVGDDLPPATGMAFAINGDFNSADIFGNAELFNKLWPKLLDSAATEAVGDLDKKKPGKSPSIEAISQILADSVSKAPKKEDLAAGGSLLRHEGKGTLAFETIGKIGDQERKIHRNILAVSDVEKTRMAKSEALIPQVRTREINLFERVFGRGQRR